MSFDPTFWHKSCWLRIVEQSLDAIAEQVVAMGQDVQVWRGAPYNRPHRERSADHRPKALPAPKVSPSPGDGRVGPTDGDSHGRIHAADAL